MSAMSRIQLACNVDDLASVAVSLGGAVVYVATPGNGLVVLGAAPAAPRLSRETRQGLTLICHLSRGPMGRTPAEGVGTSSQPPAAS